MTKIQTKKASSFNTTGNASTVNVTIDEDLAKKYSDRVVQLAKQLKANNSKLKVSDAYFLEAAQRLLQNSIAEHIGASLANMASKCAITDPKWASYSYEEIIEMENAGCNVPEEVLLWAHSQQDSDITAYEILSDTTLAEDENSKTDNNNNSLKKNVISLVSQAQDAITKSTDEFENYKTKVENAQKQKQEKENSYEDKMNEINNLTKELKTLEIKRQNGTLTKSEKKRYSELNKQLNSSTGTTMKEFEAIQSQFDEYLDALDDITITTEKNTQISEKTQSAIKDFSNFDNTATESNAVHSTTEKGDSFGALNSVLQNVKGDAIAQIAINTVTKLDEINSDILNNILSEENLALKGFATNYSENITQTENTSDNVDEAEKKDSENTEDTPKQNTENDEKQAQNTNLVKPHNINFSTKIKNSELVKATNQAKDDAKELQTKLNKIQKAEVTKTNKKSSSDKNDIQKASKNKQNQKKATSKVLESIELTNAIDKTSKSTTKISEILNLPTDSDLEGSQIVVVGDSGNATQDALQQVQDNNDLIEEANQVSESSDDTVEQTSETKEEEDDENTQDSNNTKQKAETNYEVDKGFDFIHAYAAVATSIKASADVNSSKDDIKSQQETLIMKQKQLTSMEKSLAKNQQILEQIHSKTMKKAQETSQKIDSTNTTIQKAMEEGDESQATSAQLDATNLSVELNENVSKENSQSSVYSKNIQQITTSTQALQKESGTIKTDLSKFNKKMSNQLKVSQDTIVIGAGTLGVGVAEKIAGFELIVAGASLANNPFTAAIGLAMMVTGETIFQFGNQNMLSGILAAATGGSGLLVFNNAKDARVDVEDTIKAANTHLKSSRKNAQQSRIVTQFVTETKNATSEITEISASASANVNSTDNVETDDKADKKLTRFNNDSIIDSKKKKKKVVAVSASSKG